MRPNNIKLRKMFSKFLGGDLIIVVTDDIDGDLASIFHLKV